MAEESLQKKETLDKTLDFDRRNEFIVGEIMEELPEVDSVEKHGRLQLILFPLAALLFIAVIPFLLSLRSLQQADLFLDRDFPYSSIESPLLRTAMKDINGKRQELDKKDTQIRQYQDHILNMDNKLRLLQGLMQDSLQAKEQELLSEEEMIVGEERSRLESLGRSPDEIDLALSRLKTTLETEYHEKLDEFINRELNIYQSRLKSLREERSALDVALKTAVEERQNIAKSLESDEENLLARLYQEKEYLNVETEGIRTDLKILKESRRAENYWLDELANQYIGLLESISLRNHERAENHIQALESLFTESSISELPGIAPRNEADRELVRFFSAYIGTLDEQNMKAILAETRLLIEQAEINHRAGRLQEADVGWQKIGALWPLLDRAMSGNMETHQNAVAADLNRFSRVAREALTKNDITEATESWVSGIETIPGPVGRELRLFWQDWESATEKRIKDSEQNILTAMMLEMEDAAMRYEALQLTERTKRQNLAQEATDERRILQNRIRELSRNLDFTEAERDALASDLNERNNAGTLPPAAEASTGPRLEDAEEIRKLNEELNTAQNRIDELERELQALEIKPTVNVEDAASSSPEETVLQWKLYGKIIQIVGDSLIIEPFEAEPPAGGSDLRVMRPLGVDRVIHLADGILLEASATRAVGNVSSAGGGAVIYGAPKIDDLIYVATPELQ